MGEDLWSKPETTRDGKGTKKRKTDPLRRAGLPGKFPGPMVRKFARQTGPVEGEGRGPVVIFLAHTPSVHTGIHPAKLGAAT